MTCNKCGSALPEGAIFCPDCGEKVIAEPVTTEPVVEAVVPVQTPVVTTVATAKSPLNMIAGGALALSVLVSLLWLVRGFGYGLDFFDFYNLISLAGLAMITAELFLNKKKELIPIGGLVVAAAELLYFFQGFAWERYTIDYSYLSDEFNVFTLLPSLLQIAAMVLFAGYTAAFLFAKGASYRNTLKNLWFLPSVVYAVAMILQALLTNMLYSWNGAYNPFYFENIVFMLGLMAGFAIAGLYVSKMNEAVAAPAYATTEGVTETMTNTNTQNTYTATQAAPQTKLYDNGYCDMLKHILLLLFTFGIWNFIWIYKTTEYLNCVEGEEQKNPTTQLLLCLFVPFYAIYWTYAYAKRIDQLAAQRGVQSDIAIMCLLFAIFFYFLAPIFMQDKLNSVVRPVAKPVYVQPAAAPAQPAAAPVQPAAAPVQETVATPVAPVAPVAPANATDVAAELKAYKDLLDSGIITQEEFDAKKKQILGL